MRDGGFNQTGWKVRVGRNQIINSRGWHLCSYVADSLALK